MEDTNLEEENPSEVDVEASVEGSDEDTGEETPDSEGGDNSGPSREELLLQKLEAMEELVQSQNQRFEHLAESLKPKAPQLTAEQKQLLWQTDPEKAVGSVIESKLNENTRRLQAENDKRYWDQKAESDFPTNDPKFMSELKKSYKGLIADGMSAEAPKAVYRAAQEAAMKLGLNSKAKVNGNRADDSDNSVSPGGVPAKKKSAMVSDNDPRVKWYQMRVQDPKKIAEFKKILAAKDRVAQRRGGARR